MAVPEDCSWLPKYPSRIIGLVLLGASFQPYYASSSFPVPSIAGWTPTYPSRIERKVQHASQKPFLFQAGRIALPSAPVPALAWKAQHPDRIDRRRLPVADQPSVFAVPFSRATQLTQFPSYPSQISRPRIHASQQQFSFFKLEGPPPFLSWKGEQPVAMRRPAQRKTGGARPSSGRAARHSALSDIDDALLQRLKAWRLDESRAQGVPAFVILHDRTLAEIASQRPRHVAQLAGVSGIGAAKLARYGPALVEIVSSA